MSMKPNVPSPRLITALVVILTALWIIGGFAAIGFYNTIGEIAMKDGGK